MGCNYFIYQVKFALYFVLTQQRDLQIIDFKLSNKMK